jgi:hypothetical protein
MDTSRTRCCSDFRWVEEVDFGSTAGHDLALGRCASCDMPVMTVVDRGDGAVSRVTLTRAEARIFRGLQHDAGKLKAALEAWVK